MIDSENLDILEDRIVSFILKFSNLSRATARERIRDMTEGRGIETVALYLSIVHSNDKEKTINQLLA